MGTCPACGRRIERSFRFCPWCAAPQRLKLVEFFPGHAEIESDRGKALRVSQYLEDGHVRFSVWNESGVAEAAISISDEQAGRLGAFLRAAGGATLTNRIGKSILTVSEGLRRRAHGTRRSDQEVDLRAPEQRTCRRR